MEKQSLIKTIEVNNGCIQIDILSSAKKLADFAKSANAFADSLEVGENKPGAARAGKALAKNFDQIFGRGACRKTFGTDIPSIPQFDEFWNKFEPLLNGWLKDMEA